MACLVRPRLCGACDIRKSRCSGWFVCYVTVKCVRYMMTWLCVVGLRAMREALSGA